MDSFLHIIVSIIETIAWAVCAWLAIYLFCLWRSYQPQWVPPPTYKDFKNALRDSSKSKEEIVELASHFSYIKMMQVYEIRELIFEWESINRTVSLLIELQARDKGQVL